MRKHFLTFFLVTALLFLAGMNLWLVRGVRVLNEEYIQKEKFRKMGNTQKESDLLINAQVTLSNDGLKLDNILLSDNDNSRMRLQNYIHGKTPLLVIRINELYCGECVDFILNKISRLSKELHLSGHILVLASYGSSTALKILQNRAEVPFPFYNIGQEEIILPVEDINFPYCFVLTNDLTVMHTFVPDKSVPILANHYLQGISKRYFQSDKNK